MAWPAAPVTWSPVSLDPYRDPKQIRNTKKWPAWPWLPVKRPRVDDESEVGLIYEQDVTAGGGIRVFEPTFATARSLMGQQLIDGRDLPVRVEYHSLEAMLSDGWMVD
jgi:hypothetical protein